MLTEVIMPKAGSEMEEGQIVKWLKKEGDKVEAGEIILEIMTDKVNMEIEAETSGTLLKILKHDGEIVPVITTIAYIGDEGDVIPETASAPAKEEIKEEVKAQVEEKVVEVKAETKKELKDGEYDVVVIGGGPAGYYSAIKAAQKGAKVAIAENNKFGGTCLNRGCIPTKTYLQNVEDIERIKVSSKRGIILENDNATVDVAKALKFKNSIVKKLTAGVEFLLKSNSVEMFKETAYINSNGNVTLESGKELVCGSVIFAGGSKCVKNIKGSDSSNVIDTDEALDLKEVPESLVIIGADYIGVEMAQITKNDTVFDLYCGIGTITLFMSKYAKKVYGIEIVKEAIEAAKENAKMNNVDNTEFFAGDVEIVLDDLINNKGVSADIVMFDPPRKGLDRNSINNILKIKPKKIVYISCNPATLIRDLAFFEENYDIKTIVPVDMFPFTSHVECVSVLELKESTEK